MISITLLASFDAADTWQRDWFRYRSALRFSKQAMHVFLLLEARIWSHSCKILFIFSPTYSEHRLSFSEHHFFYRRKGGWLSVIWPIFWYRSSRKLMLRFWWVKVHCFLCMFLNTYYSMSVCGTLYSLWGQVAKSYWSLQKIKMVAVKTHKVDASRCVVQKSRRAVTLGT